jgi:hypothetical protein
VAFKFVQALDPGAPGPTGKPATPRPKPASLIPGAAGQNNMVTGALAAGANIPPVSLPPPSVAPTNAPLLPPQVNPMSAKFAAMWNVAVLADESRARDALIADIKVSILASRALHVEEREFSSEIFSITGVDKSKCRVQFGYTKPQRGEQTSASSRSTDIIKRELGGTANVHMFVHSHPSTRGTPETQETFSRPERNESGGYDGDLVQAAQHPDMKYGLLTPKGGFLTVQSPLEPMTEITADSVPLINTKIAGKIQEVIKAGGSWNPARSNLLQDVQDRIKELGNSVRGSELSKYDRRFGRQMRRAEGRARDVVDPH